ncbi:MAG: hypothetical protein NC203_11785 [Firmicutes bacterium]|nr:hypothetical protein [[Eubacterium] siraeum]MCM1489034.1 hypothetical protein [Bacillota bacterium]
MDKREFYRQLMENYTVDTEKIKCNAKRRYQKQSTGMLRKWTAGIAACTAVAAAAAITVVSINSLPGRRGIDITDSSIEAAMERLHAADQRYLELSDKQEFMDIYVSFSKNLTRNEILMAISAIEDFSDINVTYLYTEKGKRYNNDEGLDQSLQFLGAKITAPTAVYNELKELRAISYLEPVEGCKYNDDNFMPIVTPVDALGTTVATDETIQVALPEVTPTSPETSDTVSTETADVTEDVSASSTAETTPSLFEHATMPVYNQKITLPLENISYGVFINEEKLVVINNDSIRLYWVMGDELKLETTFYAASAKVSWSNEDSSKLLITGCDDKGRNKLFIADGEKGYLSELNVSSLTNGDFELSSVIGSDSGDIMMIKSVSLDKTRIYYARRSGNTIDIVLVKEFDCPVSVVSCSGSTVYVLLTYTDDNGEGMHLTAINTSENLSEEIAVFSSSAKFTRNADLNLAAVTDGDNCFMLTPAGVLVPLESGSVTFGSADCSVFKCGSRYFMSGTDRIAEITEEEAKPYFEIQSGHSYGRYDITVFADGTAEILIANE